MVYCIQEKTASCTGGASKRGGNTMKKTLMLTLFLCLLCCTAHADVCSICSGDSTCDTCEGNGYVFVQVYGTNMQVKAVCSAGCDNGVCPVCPAPCDVCGSDGLCNVCSGNGYILVQVYGAGTQVKAVCTGAQCDDGKCKVCQSKTEAVLTATPKPIAAPKASELSTKVPAGYHAMMAADKYLSEIIVFTDPCIEKVILKKLGKEKGTVTREDLRSVTELYIDHEDGSVQSLADLDEMQNLKKLTIRDNFNKNVHTFSILSPLAGLKDLTYLDLNGNRSTLRISKNEYSHLSNLKNLTHLDLYGAFACDNLNLFSNLTSLEYLNLSGNNIADLKPIASLTKLKTLILSANKIVDISPLSKLTKLKRLEISYNKIHDVSPLSKLTNLETLWLGNNQISDTSPLAALTNAKEIKLDGNPTTEIIDSTSSASYSSSSSRVISSPLAVFPTISKVKLAATKRDGDLTIYQYTYMEYQFLREYLDTITYEDLTLVAEGKDNSGATHFYYRHNASGGEVEIVIDTYGKSESKFSVYAYDGITLSDYH